MHCIHVGTDGPLDAPGLLHEILAEAGGPARSDAEYVVQHQHLAIAAGAGADADDGDGNRCADLARQQFGHALEHQHLRTRLLELTGILEDGLGAVGFPTLHLVTTELVDGLGQQAQMGTDGNRPPGEMTHRLHLGFAPLDLDHVRTALLHQPAGGIEGLGRRAMAHEGHVRDDEGATAAPLHHGAVIDHLGDAHRQSALVSLYHHAQRIAHQDHVRTGGLAETGETGIVGGDDGDLLALLLHAPERRYGYLLIHRFFSLCGHGIVPADRRPVPCPVSRCRPQSPAAVPARNPARPCPDGGFAGGGCPLRDHHTAAGPGPGCAAPSAAHGDAGAAFRWPAAGPAAPAAPAPSPAVPRR